MKRFSSKFILSLGVALCVTSLRAADKYWDSNGTTVGAGATPTGTWGTSLFWNATADGTTTTPGAWVSGDTAIFSAGTDASGAFTVTVSGTQTAASMTNEEGVVTIAGGAVALGTGTITINSGATLSTDSSLRITASAGAKLTVNGGTLRTTNPSAAGTFIDTDFGITLNGACTFSATAVGILNIVQTATTIGGPGSLTKSGAGVLAFAGTLGNNTYSGGTTVNAGELRIRTVPNTLPITTDLTVTSPGIFNLNSVSQQVGSLTGNGNVGTGSGTLTISGSASTSFDGALLNITNAGATGVTTGNGRLIKNGSGTITFNGLNDINGSVTLTAGGINVSPGASLCGPISDLIVNGGTLNLSNAVQIIENLSSTLTAGTINLAPGHTLVCSNVANSAFSGTIAGAGGIMKTNNGATQRTLTLSGPNSYDGNTLINGGVISVGSATALGSTVGYTEVMSGAEVLFTGAATTFTCAEPFRIAGAGGADSGSIAVIASANPTLSGPTTLIGDATITVSSSASATFNNSAAFTSLANQNLTLQGGANASGVKSISGVIALGAGGLTKLQAGTWNLSGVNTYTGPTAVSAGRLNVNSPGSLAAGSTVTVSSGATLGGSGTINGPVTVDGTLAPGTSIGTLTLDLSPTLNATVSMEIDRGATPNADKLVVNNPLTFAGTLTVINTGAALTGGEVFDLFDATSFSGSFGTQNLPSLGAGLNWYTANLAVDGSIKVNRAPTSGADTLSTATNVTASITLNKLTVNDSDADGDTFTVTDVSAASAQGGSVALISGTANYTPPPNYGGPDSFTYTLDDAHGGATIVTVNVTVGGGTSPGANSVYAATEGSEFVVRFAGIPGETYTVEHSNTTTGPWSKLANQTAPVDNSLGFGIGVFEVREDTSGTEAGFYRTVHPAY